MIRRLNQFAPPILVALLLVHCTSMPTNETREPAFAAGDQAVAVAFKDSDKVRIKIEKLQALSVQESQKVFISARLLLCVDTQPSDLCDIVGSTRGLEIHANENKNFEREDSKSMPEIYSQTVTGANLNQTLNKLPPSVRDANAYFKIELRKNFADGSNQTIGFKKAGIPKLSADPLNAQHVLRLNVDMNAKPPKLNYGGEVTILVQRPE